MNKAEFNWRSGEVVLWEIDDLDLNKSLEPQIEDFLREDLVMVHFKNAIVLDLGWLPEFNPRGQFVLNVVKCKYGNSADWENPVFQLKFRDTKNFMQNINHAIEVAERASHV